MFRSKLPLPPEYLTSIPTVHVQVALSMAQHPNQPNCFQRIERVSTPHQPKKAFDLSIARFHAKPPELHRSRAAGRTLHYRPASQRAPVAAVSLAGAM